MSCSAVPGDLTYPTAYWLDTTYTVPSSAVLLLDTYLIGALHASILRRRPTAYVCALR